MIRHLLQFKLSFIAAATLMGLLFLPSAPVSAAAIDVLDKCDTQSKVCADRDDPNNGLPKLLENVINLLLYVIGFISVIMIIIGGIRYTTSGGDAGETKTARDTIIYAVAGLVIAIMSFAIVNLILVKI